MRIGSLLWVTLAPVLLVGCATKPPELNAFTRNFFAAQGCPDASCQIPVTVTENSDGTCSGTIPKPSLDLSQGTPNKNIQWTISDGYKFATENYKYAIVIKTDPQGKFKNANVQAGGQRLVLDYSRGATTGNSYTYGLNFKRSNNDSFCTMLDPFMVD
jgi:hypothetical protein